jgi:hypothetical protein
MFAENRPADSGHRPHRLDRGTVGSVPALLVEDQVGMAG